LLDEGPQRLLQRTAKKALSSQLHCLFRNVQLDDFIIKYSKLLYSYSEPLELSEFTGRLAALKKRLEKATLKVAMGI
jgi:hypothetical protein